MSWSSSKVHETPDGGKVIAGTCVIDVSSEVVDGADAFAGGGAVDEDCEAFNREDNPVDTITRFPVAFA